MYDLNGRIGRVQITNALSSLPTRETPDTFRTKAEPSLHLRQRASNAIAW